MNNQRHSTERYNLEFFYKKGKYLFVADTLSRAYRGGTR